MGLDFTMPLLTELPPEIVHHILGYVDPQDLSWIPRICKSLYHAVNGNTPLFKQVYLNHLDAPLPGFVNWEQSLKDLVRLQALCRSDDDKKDEVEFVHRAVTELLKNASTKGARPGLTAKLPQSRNADILTDIFSFESNQSAFLCRSFIYERARAEFHNHDIRYWHGPPKSEHQKSAHLHCLYGVPRLFAYPSAVRQTRHNSMHPFACSKVYDLRQYTEKNKWGPFLDDGSMGVDWEKVEAIMIVLGANMNHLGVSSIHMCETFCSVPFAGTWPNSWQSPHIPPSLREPDPMEHLDPYGITGVWLRVVCFLDYTDFFAYNFGAQNFEPPPHVPRPSINVGQATRLILMRIFVTSVEKPGPEDGQDLPVVHFKGVSRSLDQSFDENADSDLRGSVRLTPQGDVRWTTFSIFGGVERWRSESIQVGGVKSAKGVLGHWFDKDFDPRGPAGPTAFWKISDKSQPNYGAGEREGSDFLAEMDELDGDYESNPEGEGEEGEEGEEGDSSDEDGVSFSIPAA
ncbi:hypothetical protein EV127DRAFT_427690 [Xylaria flabelliformis]|nr:hypothetical protein EV127DRAFT_427690 [Xylaria flabelliformis]